MSRDAEDRIAQRREREADRWWRSLSDIEKAIATEAYNNPLEDPDTVFLIMSGWARIDKTGHAVLTGAGELYLHQLKLREWMVNHPRKEKTC